MSAIKELLIWWLVWAVISFCIVVFAFIFTHEPKKEVIIKSEYKNLEPFKYEVDVNLKDTTYFYKINYNK